MDRQNLIALMRRKRSFLCIGLDSAIEKIPAFLKHESNDPVYSFNRRIIDATIKYAVAYKPNLAFYESRGLAGWESLEKTIAYIRRHPLGPVFIIADAKRGDIGNSSEHYARAFFETLGVDAVTISPYMGHDSVKAFLHQKDKWAVVLALTSNPGALDFQVLQPQLPVLLEKMGIKTSYWKKLYEVVIEQCTSWGSPDNMMFVIGATQAEMLTQIRENVPDHFFLIPGVGSQGGKLEEIARLSLNKDIGILVNVSRSVLFAGHGENFDKKAGEVARHYQQQMENLLRDRSLI